MINWIYKYISKNIFYDEINYKAMKMVGFVFIQSVQSVFGKQMNDGKYFGWLASVVKQLTRWVRWIIDRKWINHYNLRSKLEVPERLNPSIRLF